MTNPENCKQAITQPRIFIPHSTAYLPNIALTGFLFFNVTCGVSWKRHPCIVVSLGFVFFFLIFTWLYATDFFFCFAYSWTELADRWFLNVWSKSGRPVSLAIVFADCGSLVGVFLSFLKNKKSGALKCFLIFHGQMCFFHWFGHSLIR